MIKSSKAYNEDVFKAIPNITKLEIKEGKLYITIT
jgi:hypothetical protein